MTEHGLARFVTTVGIGCLVALSALGVASSDDEGRGGALTGAVTLGHRLKPRAARVNLYNDVAEAIAPRQPASLADEMGNVVISLDGPGLASERASRMDGVPLTPARVEQKRATFEPHVLPVLRGSVVEFANADPYFHNVFSLSRPASFDLGRFPKTTTRSVRFDSPGVVKVFCHIHADMSAVIVVLDNPFFTSPDRDGRFRIDGIPPGTYTVTAWHERARPIRRTLTITSGQDLEARFDIPLEETAVDE